MPSHADQSPSDLRCEWGAPALQQIASSDIIVIVDVLSFSTCVDIAVSRGVTVFPYGGQDVTALAYAKEQHAELASRRDQTDGRYSLSPSSLLQAPAGLRLVLPSPNGSTLASQAIPSGAKVVAGCLRNASAIARWANALKAKVTVVAAGERWPDGSLRPAVEDLLGAGAVLRQLNGRPSPESFAAISAFEQCACSLSDHLFNSASGRELIARGFANDLDLAAEHDVSNTVPLLQGPAFVSANLP